jgi:signal transduction histidine kinase
MSSPFKSLKFKLTFWNSIILIVINLVFILSVNGVITYYYSQDPFAETSGSIFMHHSPLREWNPQRQHREIILESRADDLMTIRMISLYTFIPLVGLSIAGGLLITDQLLRPLGKLNSTISKVTSERLSEKIEHESTGDEISDLIDNFNEMITRLNTSFSSQRRFVENAAHELKTPLTIIQTNLETLESDASVSKAERNEMITAARNAATFMNSLTEDLLLLSLLDQDIPKERFSLTSTASAVIDQLTPLAEKRSISIKRSIPQKQLMIQGNEILIQRAIMNLLENAIKFSPKKSEIEVSVASKNDDAVISVSDSGPGIPKREQKKIFDRFYRIDKSRSRKTGGPGLGLSITKEIVEAHHGSIHLRSEKKGNTFSIHLPADKG